MLPFSQRRGKKEKNWKRGRISQYKVIHKPVLHIQMFCWTICILQSWDYYNWAVSLQLGTWEKMLSCWDLCNLLSLWDNAHERDKILSTFPLLLEHCNRLLTLTNSRSLQLSIPVQLCWMLEWSNNTKIQPVSHPPAWIEWLTDTRHIYMYIWSEISLPASKHCC